MTVARPTPAFEALEKTRLDLLSGTPWDDCYAVMGPWLQGPNGDDRCRTMSRLCMAILGVEGRSRAQGQQGDIARLFEPRDRLAWFLAAVDQAHARFDDVIPTVPKALGRLAG